MARDWYCVNTHAGKEDLAVRHIAWQGFQLYLPQYHPKWARKNELRPLFPGYLFVLLDLHADCWVPLRSTTGVKQLMEIEGRPQPMQTSLIDTIRQAIEAEEFVAPVPRLPSAGDKVRIVAGPLAGVTGICTWNSEKRIRWLMETVYDGQLTFTCDRAHAERIE
jgi:transcriptional antiterminator RfaH